jgi:hypothetical protein
MTISCGLKSRLSIQCTSGSSTGMISNRPISLYNRLPNATCRPAAFCMLVLINARMPLPMLAPITRPIATGKTDHAGAGQGCGEQNGREAGVGNHREQRANQGVEQDIAGQRGENHLHPLGMGDRRGGLNDQLQRQNDQPQPDRHPAHLPKARLFARQKENHPEENQQRRQPRQVERQHPRHQRGTDVGAEHGRQCRRQRHQALADERGHEHGRGVAALHHRGDDDAGDKGQPALGHVLANHMAQVGAVHPQDAGSDDVRAPDQQGHGGKQIEQGEHADPLY